MTLMSYEPISVHVLSDSLGETGEMVARAAMAQFESGRFRIERLPKVETPEELTALVRTHCGRHCIFLYTLVEASLRTQMELLCAQGVNGVDLLGPSMELLANVTGISATGEAGAVHRTDAQYFARIEAMEFAVRHDDGRNPEGLPDADIVLLGVSRTSKTPLAMYLAFKGWRVANVPLAPGIDPPPQVFKLDPRRVFGLVTDPDILVDIRTERMSDLGTWVPRYTDREEIIQELEAGRALMRQLGCIVIRTDNRAIEEAAQEIVRYVQGGLIVSD